MSTFGSLFAGVGGFDLGFGAAGWECRWQVEWDARCRSVLARRWPDVARYGDVCDVGVVPLVGRADDGCDGRGPLADTDARQGARDLLEPVDCITFGFPCQDLSVAGKRAGLDGERSGLFFEATRIFREMREATDGRYPRVVVAENVPGLLSADRGAAMGRCLDELADCGAVGVEWAVLDAQHFGVPQRRRRVFIVAWFDPRVGRADPLLPVASRCQGHPQPGTTEGEDVAGSVVPRVAATLNSGGNDGGFRTEPGEHLVPFVKVIRSGARDEHGDLPAEVWREEQVAPTLNAFDNGSESRATVLPGGVRRLTPRECCRLQGWPDDHTRWDADGNEIPDSARYRMAGNGVAAPVARWIAERLSDALEDR